MFIDENIVILYCTVVMIGVENRYFLNLFTMYLINSCVDICDVIRQMYNVFKIRFGVLVMRSWDYSFHNVLYGVFIFMEDLRAFV